MSYDWLETILMGTIFCAAALFAIRHFLPGIYAGRWQLFLRKNSQEIDIHSTLASMDGSRQAKCSACNGCSSANKS